VPIYEYRCSECGHQQEHLKKVSDPLLTTCPHCGQETYRKQLTAAGFQLKGSGWYATDFKGSGQKPAAKSDPAGTSDAKSDSKADAKSDAKVESNSETKSESKSESKTDAKTESKPSTKATTPAGGGS
jgi:putative FmdB family regulatory protein